MRWANSIKIVGLHAVKSNPGIWGNYLLTAAIYLKMG